MNNLQNEIEYDYIFKVVMLGDTAVGKTSIMTRLRGKGFKSKAEPTIGLDFNSFYRSITGGKKVKFHVWDTAGQENYNSIIKTYYRGVACAIIVIDVTNKKGLDNARKWLENFEALKSPDTVGLPVIVGNKRDLADRAFTFEEGERWANENGGLYWELSAKDNDNVDGLLTFIGNNIYNNWDGRSKSSGITNNMIKKRVEEGRRTGQTIYQACCEIV